MFARLGTPTLLLATLALAACQRGVSDPPVHGAPPALPDAPPASTTPAAGATPDPAPSPDWTLTAHGAGPVRFGMTAAELRAALGGAVEPLGPPGDCSYVVPNGAPEGLAFMIFEGRVVRADLRRGSAAATAVGVRSGDSMERARELLGPDTEVTPHKYVEGGHYLTAPGGDPGTWWVAETDGERVTDVRAGLQPQVRWIEGCS
jgi:hypothetical protein